MSIRIYQLLRNRTLDIQPNGTMSPANSVGAFYSVKRIFQNSDYLFDELIADFSDGTKSMSFEMVMAFLKAK